MAYGRHCCACPCHARLGAPHPPPQRFDGAAQLVGNGSDRGPMGRVLVGMVETVRRARSRSSWEYLLGRASAPSSLGMKPPKTRGGSVSSAAVFEVWVSSAPLTPDP